MGFVLDLDGESSIDERDDIFSDKFEIASPNATNSLAEGQCDASESQILHKDINNKFYTDEDGYYVFRLNQIIHSTYSTREVLGKGVFGCVIKASNIKNSSEEDVAIKIMRKSPFITENGLREVKIMQKITAAQKSSNKHSANILAMRESFFHEGHFCIVFDLMCANVRQVLSEHGKFCGLHLSAVKCYGRQLLQALALLEEISIIHADVKPDNLLVDSSKAHAKLGDFGCSIDVDYAANTGNAMPYLASRFYRAPELILGCVDFDFRVDIWASACTLYELYTGKVLFDGVSNEDMLAKISSLIGKFPKAVVRKGTLSHLFFDMESGQPKFKASLPAAAKSPGSAGWLPELECENIIASSKVKSEVFLFKSLLSKMLSLNYKHRISASQCLQDPFFAHS